MQRFLLSHERRSSQPLGIVWCFVATVLPSTALVLTHLPFGDEHFGLLLISTIAGGFIWWTGNNVISGVFTSNQGIYRRDQAPLRYWLLTFIIATGTALIIFGWLHQARTIMRTHIGSNQAEQGSAAKGSQS